MFFERKSLTTQLRALNFLDSEIVATPLCLGSVSKNWSVINLRKTGLNLYVYDFSIDYDANAVADILDIHKYLIKKVG